MKIIFLHLSDMHLKSDTKQVSDLHISKIIQALKKYNSFDEIVCVLTGDLAFSGDYEEYKAVNLLIVKLKYFYNKLFNRTGLKFLFVPGNHDVKLIDSEILTPDMLQKLFESNLMEQNIDVECKKQDAFLNFAKNNGCFKNDKLFDRRIIKFNEFSVEFNLINTAVFSSLCNEKGMHYLPDYVFRKYKDVLMQNCSITIMHHSYHWFNDKQKNQFEEAILSRSTIVFVGHEHIPSYQATQYENNFPTKIICGGELCNAGNWDNSEFNVCILDTSTLKFEINKFKWDKNNLLYCNNAINTDCLLPKIFINNLQPSNEYLNAIKSDKKYNISNSVFDYFVFPRIRRQISGEYTTEEEYIDEKTFIKDLIKQEYAYILGKDETGKTTLLRRLQCLFLENGKYVIFCNCDDIRSGKCIKIIKQQLDEMYGIDKSQSYDLFMQSDIIDRILIIDDVHRINKKHINQFLEDLKEYFGLIILSSDNINEFDIIERIKQRSKYGYARYQILPFFTDKRIELVDKLLQFYLNSGEDRKQICDALVDMLKRQQIIVNMTPILIIQFVQYFCKNEIDINGINGVVVGKVYEASIINSITPHVKNISVDKFLFILAKIAYLVHTTKKYPVSQQIISDVIEAYNKEYSDNVNVHKFLDVTLDSKIFNEVHENMYAFNNTNQLAYFIAQEIRRRCVEDGDFSEFYHVISCACFSINADILIMLTYISDNLNMLQLIHEYATRYVEQWEEVDWEKGNAEFISGSNPLPVSLPDDNDKCKNIIADVEIDRNKYESTELVKIGLYDYDENNLELWSNQILRANALMCIVARCLPNFEHRMKHLDKIKFVEAIYSMPQKIFYKWAQEVEKEKYIIMNWIKELNATDYKLSRHKDLHITDDDALRILRTESICLYLNIMFSSVVYAAKINTKKHLDMFNYKDKNTYSLQHIMMLDRMNLIDDFSLEAESIYSSTNLPEVKNMIQRIAYHLLTSAKNLTHQNIQHIESKFFFSASSKKEKSSRIDLRDKATLHRKILSKRKMTSYDE